jgi:23S rRNA pseudouridine1911/1915/1917 synthase
VAKPNLIELRDGTRIPILYEDRAVLAIDKPAGWLLVPDSWDRTGRNLQLALVSSLRAGDFWARSRSLKFLRYVHRLDAATSGVLLLAKTPGALRAFSDLFESRLVRKTYLAVVHTVPKRKEWTCRLKLGPDPHAVGRGRVDPRHGKDAETAFRVLQVGQRIALVEVQPKTGRTHQIRLHLAAAGHPVVGDSLYGQKVGPPPEAGLALRATGLAYHDPFNRREICIGASVEAFCRQYGFEGITEKAAGHAGKHRRDA